MVKKAEVSKLGRQDWLDMAEIVLGEGGIDAVRVEPLAKRLSVTKGSFYWHFKNRPELLEATLQSWVDRQTDSVIEQVESIGGDAATKLLQLFEIAVQDDGRTEMAIRAWAAKDIAVAQVLSQVDQRRLEYTQALFEAIGFAPLPALVRARMVYYALVGEFAIGARSDTAERLQEIRAQYDILVRQD